MKRYEILYNMLAKPAQRHRVMLKKSQEKRQCHVLGGLDSFEEYVVDFRAWGGSQPGASTRMTFMMDLNSEWLKDPYSKQRRVIMDGSRRG